MLEIDELSKQEGALAELKLGTVTALGKANSHPHDADTLVMPLMTMCDSTQLADYALPLVETFSKWNIPILKGVWLIYAVNFFWTHTLA